MCDVRPESCLGQPSIDKGHQIDELDVRSRGRLCPLQHNRTERTCRHDRAGAGLPKLLEADIADSRARLLFLVGEQQAAAGTAAIWILAIANGLPNDGAEAGQKRARLVNLATVAPQVARVVVGHGPTGCRGTHTARELLD